MIHFLSKHLVERNKRNTFVVESVMNYYNFYEYEVFSILGQESDNCPG